MEVTETSPEGSMSKMRRGVPDCTVTNSYDRTYRLTHESIAAAGQTKVTVYTYDKADNYPRLRRRSAKSLRPSDAATAARQCLTKVVSGADSGNGTTTSVIGTGSNGASSNQIKELTLPTGAKVTYTGKRGRENILEFL